MAKGKRKFASEINVVPYIDVMLVLLVIFMVTAPLMTQGVKVELPKAGAKNIQTQDQEPLIVSVSASGQFYISLGDEPKQAKSLDLIGEQVAIVIKEKPQTPVLVNGDTNVPYGEVIRLMAFLQAAGVADVGLVTEALEH